MVSSEDEVAIHFKVDYYQTVYQVKCQNPFSKGQKRRQFFLRGE
jgi:hypothetical protein